MKRAEVKVQFTALIRRRGNRADVWMPAVADDCEIIDGIKFFRCVITYSALAIEYNMLTMTGYFPEHRVRQPELEGYWKADVNVTLYEFPGKNSKRLIPMNIGVQVLRKEGRWGFVCLRAFYERAVFDPEDNCCGWVAMESEDGTPIFSRHFQFGGIPSYKKRLIAEMYDWEDVERNCHWLDGPRPRALYQRTYVARKYGSIRMKKYHPKVDPQGNPSISAPFGTPRFGDKPIKYSHDPWAFTEEEITLDAIPTNPVLDENAYFNYPFNPIQIYPLDAYPKSVQVNLLDPLVECVDSMHLVQEILSFLVTSQRVEYQIWKTAMRREVIWRATTVMWSFEKFSQRFDWLRYESMYMDVSAEWSTPRAGNKIDADDTLEAFTERNGDLTEDCILHIYPRM